MNKRLIGFAAATAAVLAVAIGYQAVGASGNEEQKGPAPATSTDAPTTTPPEGSTESPSEGTVKEDDGEREGFTEDNTGKPGENKD